MTGSALGVQIIAKPKRGLHPSGACMAVGTIMLVCWVGGLTSRQVQLYSRGNLIRRWDTMKNYGGL